MTKASATDKVRPMSHLLLYRASKLQYATAHVAHYKFVA